jgi:putative PIN family toxin of toxin-antitoxin system
LTRLVIPYMVSTGGGEIRTVIDTNVIFAGLYSSKGASHQVLNAVLDKCIQPVLSVALLFEYEEVLKRNSRKLKLNHKDIDTLLDVLCSLCSLHRIHYLWRPFLPDPKDDLVLELAVASQVKTITTFNVGDFRGVEEFGVQIYSPKKLLEEIKWER